LTHDQHSSWNNNIVFQTLINYYHLEINTI
jgi:hypothetical protein